MALSVARRLQISEKTQAMRAERFTQLCIRTSPTDTNGPTRPSLAANPALTFYLDHSVGADQQGETKRTCREGIINERAKKGELRKW